MNAADTPAPRPGSELPFAAPCRELTAGMPVTWLREAWRDFNRARRPALSVGVTVTVAAWIVAGLAWSLGSYLLTLAGLFGAVFAGPLAAGLLYSLARDIELGRQPTMRRGIATVRSTAGNAIVFGLVLLVVMLVWARAASMVSIFIPESSGAGLLDLAVYLGVGSAIGCFFVAIIIMISTFALPMLTDRQADTITAVISSVRALLRNRAAMLSWSALVIGGSALCLVTAGLAAPVVIPWLGIAAWRGYRATIDASAWPLNS